MPLRCLSLSLLALALSACQHLGSDADAEAPLEVPREFRAIWIATVANIDWPKTPGADPEVQRAEMLALLDMAVDLRLNAVILQVRPHADALYESELEPWSEYLTGANGKAPEPHWDPLAFAVAECQRRGLELHAWFNPYRVWHSSSKSTPSAEHISEAHPELVRTYGKQKWMDPGDPRVRAHSRAVIVDVVQRYDLDGVHYDDYFYPYPIRDEDGELVPFPDDASYATYREGGGELGRDDFRRDAVNQFVEETYAAVKAVKPWVKVGISPFGIWRPGNPPQIKGFDQYASIYADAKLWLQEGWCDYFTPQLYWPIAKPEQSYVALLRWWVEENSRGRHLWPGNAPYRIASEGSRKIPAEEIDYQVSWTRHLGAGGNVFFSAKSLAQDLGGIQELMRTKTYPGSALVPASPWLDSDSPAAPFFVARKDGTIELAPRDDRDHRGFVIYHRRGEDWDFELVPGHRRSWSIEPGADEIRVSAIDRSGNEGPCAASPSDPIEPSLDQAKAW